MIPLNDLTRQYHSIKAEVDAAIAGVLERSAYIMGPEVTAFEQEFARICGAAYGVGTSSGSSAVFLALKAAGIGPGDEVITVPHTFIATAEAVSQTGARVIFADIDPRTYTMDPLRAEAAVTPRTRALLVVHLYGQMADMEALTEVADRHQLILIEDAAQAHGACFLNRPAGSWGKAGTFSFFPAKNLGACGDAGMVVTDDADMAACLRRLTDHGRTGKYEHLEEGYNLRLDTLQAAILRVKLKHLAHWTQRRREIAGHYSRDLRGVGLPFIDPRAEPVFHQYVIRTPRRDVLQAALAEKGIATGIHYPIPLHRQPAYRHLGYKAGDFPHTEQAAQEILSLPVFPELTEAEVDGVIAAVNQAAQG